jgi:hypothetical protein
VTEPTTCTAAEYCRDFDRVTNSAAITVGAALCDACLGHGAMAISRLVMDYRDLENLLPKSISEWSDGQPGHSGEAPIPLRLNVEALQREIWHLTTAWAEVLADHHRLSDPPSPVRMGHAVVTAVRVIEPRVSVLARVGEVQMNEYPLTPRKAGKTYDPHPVEEDTTRYGTRRPLVYGRYPRTVALSYVSGAQGVLDMAYAHERARVLLGLTRDVRHLPGHCRNKGCARAELYQERGSDDVWCGHCGNAITRDDYDAYGNLFQRTA